MVKGAACFLVLCTLAVLLSCQKEESNSLTPAEEENAAVATAVAETEAEVVFNDVFDNVLGVNAELGIPGAGVFGRLQNPSNVDSNRCFTVTITPLQLGVFPKTVTINFGSGCSNSGRKRTGKIITVYTGRLIFPGSSAITTFENYTIDGVKIEGKHTVTNISPLGTLQKHFEVVVEDGKLTKTDGNFLIWNSKRQIRQVEGFLTETHKDDVFAISGSARGRIRTNNLLFLWNAVIQEPLIKRFTCNWISKGKIRTLRETLPASSPWEALLDYGQGECDNKATITVNGTSRQISLR